ncbi:uncharacterized protein LOC108737274 isoform X2 [Agrilus planipennis]|uniref:Uncharacterized protein LOC108737274 isoform X2 n=1 Tax=Agrilus planipennis TaxID=224129 RepID=A0A1W4WZF0_AGRPL|nr:uncharacterized protein LOC108737274 isoform X2 [Agrilus planipennis]
MFAQVLQILLSATILSTVAEQASNIEFNNERKSGINNLNANDSPDEDNNQIVRRSLLNEKVTQNEDIYYRTFYGYSSETTTKPNNQHDIDTESVDYKGRQELTTIPSYQDNSFVDERDLTVEESIGFGNRKSKKYEKNPTNQDLYTNSNDKRFTYSKQPKPSSYDKVNDYDDAFLEIQNLGSFGSKLHLKANEPKRNNQKTPSPINDVITFNLKKRKKPSRLIPNTNEIITGLDVLNINEAITSDEDNSEKNTKLGTNNDNVIQNATENIESYIQTDDHNKDVYHTAAQSITDNRVSQVKYNGDFFQKPLVEDNLATDTTISEAVTPEYRVTKISQHKVTNLSKNPIVVPDIEATIGKRVTPTQYYFKTTSYTLKPFALAEALKVFSGQILVSSNYYNVFWGLPKGVS